MPVQPISNVKEADKINYAYIYHEHVLLESEEKSAFGGQSFATSVNKN